MSDTFIKEIKEEERSDKIALFFAKNKHFFKRMAIVGAIFAVISIIYFAISSHLESKYSKILHQSLIEEENGNYKTAKDLLTEIYNSSFVPSNIKSIASLRYGSMHLIEGKKEQALEIYQKIVESRFSDRYFQDIAGLLASKILISLSDDYNEKGKKQTEQKLQKLLNKNKVLKPYLKEQIAIFYLKNKQPKKARKLLEEIIHNQEIPTTLKKRAENLTKLN